MAFHIKWKVLITSICIALGIGFLSSFFTNPHMEVYAHINKPFLSPPGYLFSIVWTVLYVLMGISSYLVYLSKDYTKQAALYMYATQLAVNFLWPIVFFVFRQYFLAFLILIVLWIMVVIMIASFHSIHRLAGILQYPYLIWLSYALYLNAGVVILNL